MDKAIYSEMMVRDGIKLYKYIRESMDFPLSIERRDPIDLSMSSALLLGCIQAVLTAELVQRLEAIEGTG